MKLEKNVLYDIKGYEQNSDIDEIILITKLGESMFQANTVLDRMHYEGKSTPSWHYPENELFEKFEVKRLGSKEELPEYFL